MVSRCLHHLRLIFRLFSQHPLKWDLAKKVQQKWSKGIHLGRPAQKYLPPLMSMIEFETNIYRSFTKFSNSII
jgi:hypothetical protein